MTARRQLQAGPPPPTPPTGDETETECVVCNPSGKRIVVRHTKGKLSPLLLQAMVRVPNANAYRLVQHRDGSRKVVCEMPTGTFSTMRADLPTFMSGMARTLDIGDGFDHWELPWDPSTDATALASDWRTVGAELKRVAVKVLGKARTKTGKTGKNQSHQ